MQFTRYGLTPATTFRPHLGWVQFIKPPLNWNLELDSGEQFFLSVAKFHDSYSREPKHTSQFLTSSYLSRACVTSCKIITKIVLPKTVDHKESCLTCLPPRLMADDKKTDKKKKKKKHEFWLALFYHIPMNCNFIKHAKDLHMFRKVFSMLKR